MFFSFLKCVVQSGESSSEATAVQPAHTFCMSVLLNVRVCCYIMYSNICYRSVFFLGLYILLFCATDRIFSSIGTGSCFFFFFSFRLSLTH